MNSGVAPGQFIPFSPIISLSGGYTTVCMPIQATVAPAGQPACSFGVAPPLGPGSSCTVGLVANGISMPPNFGPFTNVGNSWNTWDNAAGSVNSLWFYCDDDYSLYYAVYSCGEPSYFSTGYVPTPISWVAALGGTTVTIGYSAALAGVTPPPAAFTVNVFRPSIAPAYTPPVPVLSSVSTVQTGSRSVVLNVSGGTFLAADVVIVSYWPPAVSLQPGLGQTRLQLLQDQAAPISNKLPAWAGAIATVQ